jgi:hypothetical protein
MSLRLLFLLHQVPDCGEEEDAVGGGRDMKLEFLTRAPERAAALVVGAERIEASHCYVGNVYYDAGTYKLRWGEKKRQERIGSNILRLFIAPTSNGMGRSHRRHGPTAIGF